MADEILQRDQNHIVVLGGVTDNGSEEIRMLRVDPTTKRLLVSATGGGVGTVTSVSVVTANGISGSVANATTTPAITLTLGAITPSAVQISGLTASEIVGTDASKNLVSLAVATYPSLTELSYVKGVTSAIQTQLNARTVGGSDTQVQFNDGGVFGGDSAFTWNKTANTLGFAANTDITWNGDGYIFTANSAVAGVSGGNLSIELGDGNTTGSGGSLNFSGGQGGLTGDGGGVIFTSGAAGNTSGNGGSVSFFGGNGRGAAKVGGDITFQAGQALGGATVGKVKITDPSTGIKAIFSTDSLASSDKTFTFPNRTGTFATATQGADVGSANNLILGTDGDVFEITGTTQINLISNLSWQNGAKITLLFTSNPTVKHNQATSTTNITIQLSGAADFVASAGDTLSLVLSEIGGTQAWREISRAVI